MRMLWVGVSKQEKTGNIPQGYVGESKEDTAESCSGCKQRKACYYWNGRPSAAHSSMIRAAERDPERYTLRRALQNSIRSARYARGAVGGDPCVFTRAQVEEMHQTVKESGLRGLLLYTHFAETKARHLKGLALASCDSLRQVDRVIDAGWRAAVVLSSHRDPHSKQARVRHLPAWDGEVFTTPAGRTIDICPAQIPGTFIDCNRCGRCDPTQPGPPVGFLSH